MRIAPLKFLPEFATPLSQLKGGSASKGEQPHHDASGIGLLTRRLAMLHDAMQFEKRSGLAV